MSKVIVIYDSQTGNTEKMANAVVAGLTLIEDVEVELLKAGTPFSISKLDMADAIIMGSPTRYGNATNEIRLLLDAVKEQKKSKNLTLSGKVGAVFASYAWDGGWVADKLEASMRELGIDIVASSVSAVDTLGAMGVRIHEEDLQKCRDLGKTIAEAVKGKTRKD